MFEKNVQIGYLLDFYGDILSERKRAVMDDYYNNDLSLSEIASELGISRQGVRDVIVRAEAMMTELEDTMRMCGAHTIAGITPDMVRLP